RNPEPLLSSPTRRSSDLFGCNFVALNGGKPEIMPLKAILEAFLQFRETVITRRTRFLLNKARDRAHVLVGLLVAVNNVDEVIRLDRKSTRLNSSHVKISY